MTEVAMWIDHRHDGAPGGRDHIDYIQERKSYWFPYAERQW